MARSFRDLLDLEPGAELGASDWHRISQQDIDTFGKLTLDEDPYHVDPAWAREHSPLGTTIAFGFLTLSMLTWMSHEVFSGLGIEADGDTQLFNFGFNRLRLPEPVPAGAEIRGRFSLARARVRQSGGVEIALDVTVDIRGKDRPALVAEWLIVAVSA